MENLNYKEIGFMCGLEIHQQLSGRKLFCNCPSIIRKDKHNYELRRKLRASAGETGNVDKAAKYEMNKGKEFIYLGYNDTNCEVEKDEEPPYSPSKEAINTAIISAKLLNMKIVDSIQFMRKTVVDGSNTSGFQRTALIAYGGFIEINGKKIRVATLCLEEESAQVIDRKKERDTYNLSRLGIPLIEIATEPYISTPEECMLAAEHIGMILRSTGKVLRGIGTIRQDVNISVEKGARTEIKGFQEYKSIPKVIDNEIRRQLEIIRDGKQVESAVRKAEPDFSTTYLRPMPGADRMYPETDIEIIIPEIGSIKMPETIMQRKDKYIKKYGLSKDLAEHALRFEQKEMPGYSFEEEFSKHTSEYLSPANIVNAITNILPDAEKKTGKKIDFFKYKDELFSAIKENKVSASSLAPTIIEIAQTGNLNLEKYKTYSDDEIEKIIVRVAKENKGVTKGTIMGKAMAELKGKADGKKVMQLLNKILEE